MTRILVMAGGTGGHVFPALAVARRLREQGVDVIWLGTRKGLEARVVPEASFAISFISINGLRGKGVISWLLAPFKLILALVQALIILIRQRPKAVLGMGGFVTGPGGVASWLLRKPLLIHEQNAIAGLTNRLLARFASVVMEAVPGAFPEKYRSVHTGNPVRADIAAVLTPEQRLSERSGPIRLLVIGGSLGAKALNEILPAALQTIPSEERPEVWHQAGELNSEQTRLHYSAAGVEARVEPFINDMAAAYAWADLVLCRAGALTIAELAAVGVASILVPFPHAVDDHQTANARILERAGAATLVTQSSLSISVLGRLLKEFQQTHSRLMEMACAARKLAMPDACDQIARLCMESGQ